MPFLICIGVGKWSVTVADSMYWDMWELIKNRPHLLDADSGYSTVFAYKRLKFPNSRSRHLSRFACNLCEPPPLDHAISSFSHCCRMMSHVVQCGTKTQNLIENLSRARKQTRFLRRSLFMRRTIIWMHYLVRLHFKRPTYPNSESKFGIDSLLLSYWSPLCFSALHSRLPLLRPFILIIWQICLRACSSVKLLPLKWAV